MRMTQVDNFPHKRDKKRTAKKNHKGTVSMAKRRFRAQVHYFSFSFFCRFCKPRIQISRRHLFYSVECRINFFAPPDFWENRGKPMFFAARFMHHPYIFFPCVFCDKCMLRATVFPKNTWENFLTGFICLKYRANLFRKQNIIDLRVACRRRPYFFAWQEQYPLLFPPPPSFTYRVFPSHGNGKSNLRKILPLPP